MGIAIGFFVGTFVVYFAALWLVPRVRRWRSRGSTAGEYLSDEWLREQIRGRREP